MEEFRQVRERESMARHILILGASYPEVDRTVDTVDQKPNEKIVVGGSGAS
jgi:hypothetical protein